MSLEELLKSRIIREIRPNHRHAASSLGHARKDIETAKKLVQNDEFDWSLAILYNAMLLAGRALMFNRGYRPSSTEGHVAVIKFLQASLGKEVSDKMVIVLDQMRKKRHRIIYEEIDIVSKKEAELALKWAQAFVSKIEEIIH